VGVLLGYLSKKKGMEELTRGPGESEKREGESRRCRGAGVLATAGDKGEGAHSRPAGPVWTERGAR